MSKTTLIPQLLGEIEKLLMIALPIVDRLARSGNLHYDAHAIVPSWMGFWEGL